MKTCAIIIAAYKAEKYIGQCIASVFSQKPAPGWNYQLRVGVDGCQITNKILKIPHWFSRTNVGAYVMRNSLIYLDRADAYSYFDSDDVMLPDYLRKSLAALDRTGVVMTSKFNADCDLRPMKSCFEKGGAITYTHEALASVGGYYNYRCAADTDVMFRLEMAGYGITVLPDPLYYRRIHRESLTKSKLTAYGSVYRKKSWAEMTARREQGIIKIKPTIVALEYIDVV